MQVTDIKPITQLSGNTSYVDGRPCFAPDGETVLFERKGGGITLDQLWSINLGVGGSETLFYKNDTYACLRAAWSWNPDQKADQIAFTANSGAGSFIILLTLGGETITARQLTVNGYKANKSLSYPAWYGGEEALLITDYTGLQLIKATTSGDFLGVVSSRSRWAGMGTVSAANGAIIAYAGQSVNREAYDQQVNQIWIQQGIFPNLFSNKATGAIGRAPWFSPDGSVMAFEAQVDFNPNSMQICLKKVGQYPYNDGILTVSDPSQFAQHAKFSPDGSKLVWMQNTGLGKAQIFMGTITY